MVGRSRPLRAEGDRLRDGEVHLKCTILNYRLMDNFATNQLGWSKWRWLKPPSFLVMTEARLQSKLETNSTDAKEQNTRAAAEQARSILYSEAWWFLRWYCFFRSHLTKEMFPYTKRVSINSVGNLISVRNIWFLAPESICESVCFLVSGNPTFSTTSHGTNDFSRSRFLKGLEFGMEEFCFLFLCFYQLVVCVFFVFVHFLFCHLLLYACPFVFFHVFVYESTLIVSFTFIGLFSVSNF